jgi:hypothetical protein
MRSWRSPLTDPFLRSSSPSDPAPGGLGSPERPECVDEPRWILSS